ncbi:MarR family transcriptional regulator [Clostridium bowmanii]|uniref:MarR family winged helix-turn-helix transcriptional regulator n=1 Tax=Clostridium bowmanii TaxID=132925 RepID=UPI001C0D64F2|nr:MarR family transcriptional regulator [Clostridium bowmanii]MBU3188267.1 MarR family transcriptional regulator [Clostridium bowmanii]MCA1072653.1 MarR family transcriptional regulator [Clostridium bowmanii]
MTCTYEFLHQLLKLSRTVVSDLNTEIIQYNLHHSQWRIIRFLEINGPSTLVEIANYLSVEKSSVTRAVDRLKKSEFIEEMSGKDKRERRIKLSDQLSVFVFLSIFLYYFIHGKKSASIHQHSIKNLNLELDNIN